MKKNFILLLPWNKVPILPPQSPYQISCKMKQLTEGQRYKLEAYLQAGKKER